MDNNQELSCLRYLGVDIRPSSYGFVVIENQSVLDSGVRECNRCGFDNCLGQRFGRILQVYKPSIIIFRLPTDANGKSRKIWSALKRQSLNQGIATAKQGQRSIRQYFGTKEAKTKYQMAERVAQIFPELAWKLPSRRKAWQAENYRMSIFDAAAAVVTFVALHKSTSSLTPPLD